MSGMSDTCRACGDFSDWADGCSSCGAGCTCTTYVVDYSDPDRYHPENIDREGDPACPLHGAS